MNSISDIGLHYYTLPSGIRVLHRAAGGNIAHLAFIFNIGSRDELPGEHGMAHYIEHCLFKGTRHRRAYHVLSRLEDVGGELNAFTSKEDICIHGSFLPEYLGRAMELFTDIAFGSVYPEKEMEKEKDVIADEINSYRESPADLIFEDIEQLVFPSNPLGRTILGTEETIASFTRDGVISFLRRNFSPERMIVCVSGDVPGVKVRDMVLKYTEPYSCILEREHFLLRREKPSGYTPVEQVRKMDTHQSHIIMAAPSFDADDDRAVAMSLLTNLLGGPSMSARLNLTLRERYALAYSVEAFYTGYSDTGISGVYVATDGQTAARARELALKELKTLREKPLGTLQLHKAKMQMTGQLAIASENNLNQLLATGKSYLMTGRADTFAQMAEKIQAVAAGDIMDIANRVYAQDNLTTLVFESDKDN